jgi:hypothetical protein
MPPPLGSVDCEVRIAAADYAGYSGGVKGSRGTGISVRPGPPGNFS